MKKGIGKYDRWCLYWIAYDGEEDCYVVARNWRSALSYDANYCGYNPEYAAVAKVVSIPASKARFFFKRKSRGEKISAAPRHADNQLIKSLGGEQRNSEEGLETRFDDLVYTTEAADTAYPREIGSRFLKNLHKSQLYKGFGEEDSYDYGKRILFELMGACLARVQEIEFLIAHSFVFAVADPQKHKYKTITDWVQSWKKKTFGRMIRDIEHSFVMDQQMKEALHAFKDMRNLFVHGITMSDKFHIDDPWGRDELVAFLAKFEFISRAVRKAFRSSYYASIDFGNEFLLDGEKKAPLTKKQKEEIYIFTEFFEPIVEDIDGYKNS